VELGATPFHPQEVNHCGPAALASALGAAGIEATPDSLAPTVYLPARQGSLPLDMLGGARRAGAMAVRTAPGLEALMEHVAAGVPVVVLQNLSLQWVPMWHYAVVIGFDRPGGRLILRSGVESRQALSLRTFEHTWARSGHWAMIAFRPGQLPVGVPREPYTESAVALERLGRLAEARAAYEAGLTHWPGDPTLAVGLANVAHAQGDRGGAETALMQPLGQFLDAHGFSREFRDWYFLPMLGCIWSCPTDQMLAFPVSTMIRFCHNHGLIQVTDRPQWWTVDGGARQYVRKIVAGVRDARLNTPARAVRRTADGVEVRTDAGWERFDRLVLATHSDQALALLADASPLERELLGAIRRYQPNRAVLHTDVSVLPQRRKAWAAWNYERGTDSTESARVCLHYLLNQLQPLPWQQPVVVSLNPVREIDPATVIGDYDYAHPVFDLAAIRAQSRMTELQGRKHTWYCGAWMGYGCHEDGLKSALEAVRLMQRHLARAGTTAPAPDAPALEPDAA